MDINKWKCIIFCVNSERVQKIRSFSFKSDFRFNNNPRERRSTMKIKNRISEVLKVFKEIQDLPQG